MLEKNKLYTENELSEILRVPAKTLQDWRYRGLHIPFVKLGKLVRYRAEAVEAYLEGNTRINTANLGELLATGSVTKKPETAATPGGEA